MVKLFIDSLISLKKIYENRNVKWAKVIIYYIILVLIFSFPVNLANVRNKGLKVDGEIQRIKNMITKDYREDLPEDCDINSIYGLDCHESENVVVDAGDLTILILPHINDLPDNSLSFYHDKIVFKYDENIKESNYGNYENIITFYKLKNVSLDESINLLVSGFQESFSPIDTLNAVIFTTGTNLLINTLYILIASFLAMFFKYAHNQYLKYGQIVKIYVFSSTWPSLIGLLLGLLKLYPFANVIYQFGTPIMFLIIYYKQIKPNLS